MPCRPSISSMSLGRAWEHALFDKLTEASKAGFSGVEIFYEDLAYLASTYDLSTNEHPEVSRASGYLLRAAADITTWCQDLHLEVICLQPFMSYEGLTDAGEHAARIEKLKLWLQLCEILNTDLILVPSTFQPKGTTGNVDLIVKDMLEIADLAAGESPPVRLAYENLAWGTYVDTWEQVYDIVQRVNKPNFGLCLDTFNICGRIWADPTSRDGKVPNADEELTASMARLIARVDSEKIFFIQVIDAERMEKPLVQGHPWHKDDQPARMSWSRNARLFAYEEGAYLPVEKVLEKIFRGLQWEGWVSMELFSRTMGKRDGAVPAQHAKRGILSWERMKKQYSL